MADQIEDIFSLTSFNLANCPITQVCRTCAQFFDQESTLNSIFEDIKDINCTQYNFSINYIIILLELNITENDGLPQQICYDCLEQMIKIHRFREECKIAQDKLTHCYKKPNNSSITFEHIDIVPMEMCKTENDIDDDIQVNIEDKSEIQQMLLSKESSQEKSPSPSPSPENKNKIKKKKKKSKSSEVDGNNTIEKEPRKRSVTVPRIVQCEICGQIFRNNSNLKIHLQNKHKMDVGLKVDENKHLSCPICQRKFAIPSGLKRHMNLHNNVERKFTCTVCQYSFKRAWHLKRHFEAAHMDHQQLECRYCDRTFKDPEMRYAHERYHKNEQHECKICKKTFKVKKELKFHERRHTGQRFSFCSLCEKSFVDNNSLARHYRSKHSVEEIERLKDEILADNPVKKTSETYSQVFQEDNLNICKDSENTEVGSQQNVNFT